MTLIDSLDKLVWSVLGAILLWLGKVVSGWIQNSTEQRRRKVDAQAAAEQKQLAAEHARDAAELRTRLLTESLHEHRNIMLRSGQWTRETLPAFIEE